MLRVAVLDAAGQRLSPCSLEKAQRMLAEGKATLVSSVLHPASLAGENPLAIQLSYKVSPFVGRGRYCISPSVGRGRHCISPSVGRGAVSPKPQPELAPPVKPGAGKRLLLHICCGPCSTYTIKRLREQGFDVTGFWYNPNIHPFAEHERRRECITDYARAVGLAMMEWEEYEMPTYFRAVAGHETFGERCALCYRLRLERTAEVAQQNGFNAFSTTLLISPYQQQALIRSIGDELAGQLGTRSRVLGGGSLEFYFENLRRGWSERGHMAREYHLYQQQYCGCVYSEWEAAERSAAKTGRVAL